MLNVFKQFSCITFQFEKISQAANHSKYWNWFVEYNFVIRFKYLYFCCLILWLDFYLSVWFCEHFEQISSLTLLINVVFTKEEQKTHRKPVWQSADQGGLICGAIKECSRLLKAVDVHVFINILATKMPYLLLLATKMAKMTGETPEVCSDKRKPRMFLRHRIS